MKYFKPIAFVISVLIFTISCNQHDRFNSLDDGADTQQVIGSVDDPNHAKEIKTLVNQQKIVKIGGGKKSASSIDVSEGVGQNRLKAQTSVKTTIVNQSPDKGKPNIVTFEVGIKGGEKKVGFSKKLNLLFYIKNKKSRCLADFKKYSESFLAHLEKAPDWKIAFAFQGNKKEIMPLIGKSGDFLYKKNWIEKKKRARSVFTNTIEPHYAPDKGGDFHIRRLNEGSGLRRHTNVLKGLSESLKIFSDDKKQTVVLYFDDYPYYSAKEWQDFYKKHTNLTILVISTRKGNVSNLQTAHDASVDLVPVFGCNAKTKTTKMVEDTLNHILTRLK